MQTAASCVKVTRFVDQTTKPQPRPLEVLCLYNNVTLLLPLLLTDNSHYSHTTRPQEVLIW